MNQVFAHPRVTFGIIVLNGEPFLPYNLRALYPFAHQIIVVEGACVAAAPLATPEGHSTDGTLEMLRQFKRDHDPDNKLVIVTGEDAGKSNGFWSEKDEMSQAYACRATGDWLWQVDADEFYLEDDFAAILEMLQTDPSITAVSFPYKQFWGGFDYLEDGQWFRYDHPAFHRLFRWGAGYQYVRHRPPTVVDERGRDLRTVHWVSHEQIKRRGIYLYHYSYVFPSQAEQKVGYYANVTWTSEFQDNARWLNERFLKLGDPYHIGEGLDYVTWLERHRGAHPRQISQLKKDLDDGTLRWKQRPTADIEALLQRQLYALARRLLSMLLFIQWHTLSRPMIFLKDLLRRILRFLGLGGLRGKLGLLFKYGLAYRAILGYMNIPTWLAPAEAKELYDLARKLPAAHPIVVEIGSWLGSSSVILAKGLASKSDPALFCIDPFNADGDSFSQVGYKNVARQLKPSLLEQFMANMRANRVEHIIHALVGYSHELAPGFDSAIDCLFIDGSHNYASVLRDFQDWSPKLKVGGYIAFHDVVYNPVGDDFPGPAQVVKQFIHNNPQWANGKLVHSLYVAQKVSV